MNTSSATPTGVVPRATRTLVPLIGMLLVALSALAGVTVSSASAHEGDPGSGTVSVENPIFTWTGESYPAGTSVDPALCGAPANTTCDHITLDVHVDPSYWDNKDGGLSVGISWPSSDNDFDLRVFDAAGNEVGESAAGGTDSEQVFIPEASGTYEIVVNPWLVTASSYDGMAELATTRGGKPSGTPVGGEVPTEPLYDVPCDGGLAGPFPCQDIDLGAYLPLDDIGVESDPIWGRNANDIWGWTDPETGREYALVGSSHGTSFVDVTEPTAPVHLGILPTHQPLHTLFQSWRDVKVYADHAFIVSEEPAHGMQVFDLTQLRGATEPRTWSETAHYPGIGGAHNIAINEDTGYAYVIGSATCDGGPHIVDIRTPRQPLPAGCVASDGYTHDTQAVVYDGPDSRYVGHEILFNFNEDTVTIVDVTDKANPVQLGKLGYDAASYTHQGWLTEDSRHLLFNDELDEQENGTPTTTYVADVADLENPTLVGGHEHATPAIDHNLYTKDGKVYEANYRAGLRILSTKGVAQARLRELGFFDVYPADDAAQFNGAWSSYPYFESGTVVVSGIEQGLFVLTPTGAAAR